MATDGSESDSIGGSEPLIHDLMTALAVAKGNTQLIQRRFAGARRVGSLSATGVLNDAELSERMERIDAAIAAAIDAGRALIDYARTLEKCAADGQAGPDETQTNDGARPDSGPRERI